MSLADLKEPVGSLHRAIQHRLFDATVVKSTANGVPLVGFEIQCVELVSTGASIQHGRTVTIAGIRSDQQVED